MKQRLDDLKDKFQKEEEERRREIELRHSSNLEEFKLNLANKHKQVLQ